MRALIIANGNKLKKNIFANIAKNNDYIICVDGGLNNIKDLEIIPDVIIGDLDSVEIDTFNKYREVCNNIIKYNEEKDKTDTELAIEYAISNGYHKITLTCATGTRLDHTLANAMLLDKYTTEGIYIKIIDNKNEIQFLNDKLQKLKLIKKKNYFTSIIPLTDTLEGITLKGFKYNLVEKNIIRGSTLCVSNNIIEDYAEITIRKGKALVFTSID